MSDKEWKKPSVWTDEERMGNLMALFKKREVNPQDYDHRLHFWRGLITSSAIDLGEPVLSLGGLERRFVRARKVPAGLRTVLAAMEADGEVERLSDWESKSGGWLSWGVASLTKPVSWLLGSSSSEVGSKGEEWLLPGAVATAAEAILSAERAAMEAEDPTAAGVVELEAVRERALRSGVVANDRALQLALTQLERDGELSRGTSPSGHQILKFRCPRTQTKAAPTLTDVDKSTVALKAAAAKTEKEITAIEGRIEKLKLEAKACVRSRNKTRAKTLLRQKQMWEKKLGERDTQLGNLHSLLHKVTQTHDQKFIMDAYKIGVTAFKSNMERHGLSPDKIDETMDDIQGTMDDYTEISDAIGTNIRTPDAASEGELEAELDALLNPPPAPKAGKRPADGATDELPWPAVPNDVSLRPEISPPAAKKPNAPTPRAQRYTPSIRDKPAPRDRLAELRAQLDATS